ncbi:MAG: formylglycine-generating enzyme family protein, partial [Pseudomonadota bacterium]
MKINRTGFFLLISVFVSGLFGCAPEVSIEQPPKLPPFQPQTSGHDMVLVPAGEFLMGSTPQNVVQAKALYQQETGRGPLDIWFEDEAPAHRVYLDAYYIDRYEVTNGQYKEFVEATNYRKPFNWMDAYFRQSNKPVMGIEWEDAQAYATWAGKRLPTEAEWEKAARGGLMGKLFPWGDEPPQTFRKKYDYVPGKEHFSTGDWEYHMPVGSSDPNGYGIYEMTSNVYEWCYDWYSPDYYEKSPSKNPTGPKEGAAKVVRGGSWFLGSFDLRCAYRN